MSTTTAMTTTTTTDTANATTIATPTTATTTTTTGVLEKDFAKIAAAVATTNPVALNHQQDGFLKDNDHDMTTYFEFDDFAGQFFYDYRLYPTKADFDDIVKDYLQNLSTKKRDKALIDRTRYNLIIKVLKDPRNTSISTAQFRFWVKKMFKYVCNNSVEMVCHDDKPVAMREDIYDILMLAHSEAHHGGRDKTSALVRCRYSWIPKELIARFVRQCPFCITRRNARAKGMDYKPLEALQDAGYRPAHVNHPHAIADLGISTASESPSPRTQSQAYTNPGPFEQNKSVWETWKQYKVQDRSVVGLLPMETERESNHFYHALSGVLPSPFPCEYDTMASEPLHTSLPSGMYRQLVDDLNRRDDPFSSQSVKTSHSFAPPPTSHPFWQRSDMTSTSASSPSSYFATKSFGPPFAGFRDGKSGSETEARCNPVYVATAAAAIAAASATSRALYTGPTATSTLHGHIRTSPSPSLSLSSLPSPVRSPSDAKDNDYSHNLSPAPAHQAHQPHQESHNHR